MARDSLRGGATMQTIHATLRTGPDGTLTLRVALDQPDTEYEVVVVVQPRLPANGATMRSAGDPWAGADAIHQRLRHRPGLRRQHPGHPRGPRAMTVYVVDSSVAIKW